MRSYNDEWQPIDMVSMRRLAPWPVAAFVALSLAGCATMEGHSLTLNNTAVTCFVDAGSGLSVMQVPLAVDPSLGFEPSLLRVEFDSPQDVTLAGIGMAEIGDGYDAAQPLPTGVIESLVANRDDTMLDQPIDRDGTSTLVLLLKHTGSVDGTIDSFRIFWGGGEPIYWQLLDVSASVGDSCMVTPN